MLGREVGRILKRHFFAVAKCKSFFHFSFDEKAARIIVDNFVENVVDNTIFRAVSLTTSATFFSNVIRL